MLLTFQITEVTEGLCFPLLAFQRLTWTKLLSLLAIYILNQSALTQHYFRLNCHHILYRTG